jgi:hypothetical protein
MTPASPSVADSVTSGSVPVTLTALSAHWLVALSSATSALGAAAASGTNLRFDEADLREFANRLTRERVAVTRLLDLIAREDRLVFHNALTSGSGR